MFYCWRAQLISDTGTHFFHWSTHFSSFSFSSSLQFLLFILPHLLLLTLLSPSCSYFHPSFFLSTPFSPCSSVSVMTLRVGCPWSRRTHLVSPGYPHSYKNLHRVAWNLLGENQDKFSLVIRCITDLLFWRCWLRRLHLIGMNTKIR